MHPILALRAFFAAMFGGKLPAQLLPATAGAALQPNGGLLPDEVAPLQAMLTRVRDELSAARARVAVLERGAGAPPAAAPATPAPAPTKGGKASKAEAKELKAMKAALAEAQAALAEAQAAPKAPAAPAVDTEALRQAAAAQLLAVFQAEGKLVDFLMEDIEGYEDDEVGAAVREIHRGCKKALGDHFELAPVRSEEEEARVTVAKGYDAASLRLVGEVVGKPPFTGELRHKGWRAEAVRMPRLPEGAAAMVVQPAEVEL